MIEPEVDDVEEGAPEWMVTFADLMSLLLTFFVLLLSFSNMEIVKFRTMAGAVRNALGLKSQFDLADTPMGRSILPYENPKEGNGRGNEGKSQGIRTALQQMLRDAGIPMEASVRETPRGIALQIHGDLLFDSGKAELNVAAYPILDRLADYLLRSSHYVDVEGHTDNRPIATMIYPSNWELSAARAGRAVRYLAEKGVPAERLRAIGFADNMPIASNDDAAGRGMNRRVEFLFLKTNSDGSRADHATETKTLSGFEEPGTETKEDK